MGILDSLTDNTEDETTGISPAMKWQAGFQGLTNLGAGLMAYGSNTRNPWGLIAGAQGFTQPLAQIAQYGADKPKRDLQKMQVEKTKRDYEREGKIDADVMAMIPTLPTELQPWAKANPLEFSKMVAQSKLTQMNQKPALPDGMIMGPDGQVGWRPGYVQAQEQLSNAKRAQNEKAIPAPVTKGMQENLTSLKKIDSALAEIDKNPGSVGWSPGTIAQRVMPEMGGDLNNRYFDPAGSNARAAVADIGSLKVHDRSGAAVTASEVPRLVPFIPKITDDVPTLKMKLDRFRQEYNNNLMDTHGYYNREQGFAPYKPAEDYLAGRQSGGGPAAPQGAGQQGGPKAGTVVGRTSSGREVYIGEDGRQYVR